MKTCPQCGTEYDALTKFCPTDGSTLRTATGDDIIGSVIADRYHVIRKLGEGGMGQVYLAEHIKMGRMSAIKVMMPALVHDTDAVGRFNREAANASKITHPNIAAIYDFGETRDGMIYLAMEFVEGESLTKLCEALGALPAPRAANISRQVADALEAAHERGIVHRDLKPDNIMISRGREGADLVKVVDFGIAKAAGGAGQKVTRTGLVVGTPEYMSPEQLTGDTLDGRSDLYALALVTFNMLTGTLPFTGQTTQEALLKRLTDRPLSLAEARGDLSWPPALQAVLDRALSRLAADRYQHASEFGAAVAAAVVGMPADSLATAPTLQLSAATSGTRARSAAATAPSAVRPVTVPARQRLLVPATLAAAVVLVGGLLYWRSHRALRVTESASVAIAPATDTAATADAGFRDSAAANHLEETAAPAPSSEPPAAPATSATAERTAPMTADRARNQVDGAAAMIAQGKPEAALQSLRGVLPALPTRDDSVTVFYYMSHAMVLRAAKTGDPGPHNRGCSILTLLQQATAHPKAGEIRSLYQQECK